MSHGSKCGAANDRVRESGGHLVPYRVNELRADDWKPLVDPAAQGRGLVYQRKHGIDVRAVAIIEMRYDVRGKGLQNVLRVR